MSQLAATVSDMKMIVWAVLLLLFTTACGDSGADADEDSGSTGVVEKLFSDLLTEDEIAEALLSLEDLPSGWTVSEDTSEDIAGEATIDNPKCEEFNAILEDDSEVEGLSEGDVAFSQGDWGPFLNQTIASMEGNEIEKAFSAFSHALSACDGFTETKDDGSKVEYKLQPMSFPDLGDDSLAFTMSADADGFPFELDAVVVRVDQNLVLMASAGIGQGLTGEELEAVVRTAVAKVKDAA